MEKSCNDVTSVNNSGIFNENATDENKERPMIIRSYPKSPIRNSEFDDLFNLELQSTPCYQPKEKYAVFQKYFPSNDDHDLSQQSCHMENDTADLIGSTRSLIFKSSTEEDSMHHSGLKENAEIDSTDSNDTKSRNDKFCKNDENICEANILCSITKSNERPKRTCRPNQLISGLEYTPVGNKTRKFLNEKKKLKENYELNGTDSKNDQCFKINKNNKKEDGSSECYLQTKKSNERPKRTRRPNQFVTGLEFTPVGKKTRKC